MTNDQIIKKCIILSPGYSSSCTLAINSFAWESYHPGKQQQNQKCWRTYGIHITLCIKISEVKCKILLSVEIIMSYFMTFGEAAEFFLLPPLISKSFFQSWRPKKDRQILVSSMEKQSRNRTRLPSCSQKTRTNNQWRLICMSFLMAQDRHLYLQREHLLLPSLPSQTSNSQSAPVLLKPRKQSKVTLTREGHHSEWSAKKTTVCQ